MTTYTYNITDTSNNKVLPKTLQEEIKVMFPDLQGITRVQDEIHLVFPTDIDKTTLDTIISNHEGTLPLSDLIIASYNKHESNGRDYYNRFRANLIVQVKAGTLTMEEASDISVRLDAVTVELKGGNWFDAKVRLSQITEGGALSQSVIDELMVDFDTYITNNY